MPGRRPPKRPSGRKKQDREHDGQGHHVLVGEGQHADAAALQHADEEPRGDRRRDVAQAAEHGAGEALDREGGAHVVLGLRQRRYGAPREGAHGGGDEEGEGDKGGGADAAQPGSGGVGRARPHRLAHQGGTEKERQCRHHQPPICRGPRAPGGRCGHPAPRGRSSHRR